MMGWEDEGGDSNKPRSPAAPENSVAGVKELCCCQRLRHRTGWPQEESMPGGALCEYLAEMASGLQSCPPERRTLF